MSVSEADHEAIACANVGEAGVAAAYDSDEDVAITGGERLNFDPPPPVCDVEIESSQEMTKKPAQKKRKKVTTGATTQDDAGNATLSINNRTTHSIAHGEIASNNLIFLEIDLETGGENVGVVQISCIAHKLNETDIRDGHQSK